MTDLHTSSKAPVGRLCSEKMESVLQIFWAVGTVFEVLLAILVMPTLGWRWLLGLSTIPLFIFAILCFVSMFLHLSFFFNNKYAYV